ncbi:MAG: hypothetical protein Q8N14_04685 [Candidatus Omnitrophota bacterium]|nr:hypothetical protein [Candidatus Omnitrophota bacterium]
MKLRTLIGILLLVVLIGCSKTAQQDAVKEVADAKDSASVNTLEAADVPELTVAPIVVEATKTDFKRFDVYTDKASPTNHYIASGWMGDFSDTIIDDAWIENPHSGSSCIKIVYSGKASGGARWAGIYWQNPANNWGSKKGGFDLTGATKLSFWAKGENGGERIEEFKLGGITGEYPDSDAAGIGPVILTKEWKQYTIDLRGKDLSYISGGFCWATNLDVNPNGATFYIDDIVYE